MSALKPSRMSLTLALIACLFGASVAAANFGEPAAEYPVAEVEISESVIVWYPLTDEAIGLTVSGPDGVTYLEFKSGETPYFKVTNDAGELRPDGTYTFGLVGLPEIDAPGVGGSYNGRKYEIDPAGLPKLLRQTGSFMICEGYFADPKRGEEGSGVQAPVNPAKDEVIFDDLIVDGSACIGFDCVNGESFGFDTIRLKENNLRIKFEDTSSTASFPSTDWQLTANDTANGGMNKFSIDDVSSGRTPFTVEGNAPNHSLYVDDGGRLGLGTSTPVADVHAKSGNTPTVRLEQDGSSGFAPQTFDLGSNEANFFIRDATNGSTLPFRIRPGAPSNILYLDEDGVGMGSNTNPSEDLHVRRADGTTKVLIEEATSTAGTYTLLELETTGGQGINLRPRFTMTHGGLGAAWNFDVLNDGNFAFIRNQGSVFTFTSGGDLQIEGDFISSGQTLNVPDYVFADDYHLMPLDEVQSFIKTESHLPHVPSASEITAGSFNLTEMQLTLLRKVEELTLYTLDQHTAIQDQQEVIRQHQQTIADHQQLIRDQQELIQRMAQRLDSLETSN